jgi:hypothetical protein
MRVLRLGHDRAAPCRPTAPSHPVRRRPTHYEADLLQGAKVERPTGRTTLAPWSRSAWLRLGRRWTGWFPSQSSSAPAGGILNVQRSAKGGRRAGRCRPEAASRPSAAGRAALARRLDSEKINSAVRSDRRGQIAVRATGRCPVS